jgi:hypothetical protein
MRKMPGIPILVQGTLKGTPEPKESLLSFAQETAVYGTILLETERGPLEVEIIARDKVAPQLCEYQDGDFLTLLCVHEKRIKPVGGQFVQIPGYNVLLIDTTQERVLKMQQDILEMVIDVSNNLSDTTQ